MYGLAGMSGLGGVKIIPWLWLERCVTFEILFIFTCFRAWWGYSYATQIDILVVLWVNYCLLYTSDAADE